MKISLRHQKYRLNLGANRDSALREMPLRFPHGKGPKVENTRRQHRVRLPLFQHLHHVIQRPFVDDMNGDRFVTTTFMHYVETRLDEQQLLALTAKHDLALVDGALRIANKRVDIVNCDAAFRNIQLLP